MKKYFFLIFISTAIVASAQSRPDESNAEQPTSCEVSQRILDTMHQLAADGTIIIIAKLGSGERASRLNKDRLQSVSTYLQNAWKRSPETIVLATGDKREQGLGRLDIYAEGKNIYSLFAGKSQNIKIHCRNPD